MDTTTINGFNPRPRYSSIISGGRQAPNWRLVGLVLLFSFLGLISTYTTTYYDVGADKTMRTQIMASLIGLCVFAGFAYFDYGHLRRPTLAIGFTIAVVIMLISVLIVGTFKHGAWRVINVFGFSVQPSEFAKLALIIYGATWLHSRKNQLSSAILGLLPYSIFVGLMVGLIAIQPDKSTALITAIAALSMFVVSGASLRYIFMLVIIASVGVFVVTQLGIQYIDKRIADWTQGLDNIHVANDQIRQSWQAFASAPLFGAGPGFGTQKFAYPLAGLADTDSVLPVLTEEFGWVAIIILIILFYKFVRECYFVALNSNSRFGTYLVIGVTTWIVYQTVLNFAGNLSAIPLGGIPVPFLSRGGSNTIAIMAACGIIVSVSRGTIVQIALHDPEDLTKNQKERKSASTIFRRRDSRSRTASLERAQRTSTTINIGRDARKVSARSSRTTSRFANSASEGVVISTENRAKYEPEAWTWSDTDNRRE